jgi:hypothetical protein
MDESELMSMRRVKPVEAGVEDGEKTIVTVPAMPFSYAASSATLHSGPPGLSSSKSMAIGCNRARASQNDSDLVTEEEEEEEIDSGAQPVTALGEHGWTRR